MSKIKAKYFDIIAEEKPLETVKTAQEASKCNSISQRIALTRNRLKSCFNRFKGV